MMERMIKYFIFRDKRFYGLWLVILAIGLVLMVSTVSTGDLDEIERSDMYIFIIFLIGLFLSLLSIQVMVNVCFTRNERMPL